MTDKYDDVINKLNKAMVGQDVNVAMPALTGYLAQVGAIFGYDQTEFKAFVSSSIDDVFREYNERIQN